MSFRVSVGTDEGPKKGLVYLMSSLGLVDVVSRCVMMIFGDSITNVSMMKSCSPFSKKPIPELDGNMLRKKSPPKQKTVVETTDVSRFRTQLGVPFLSC